MSHIERAWTRPARRLRGDHPIAWRAGKLTHSESLGADPVSISELHFPITDGTHAPFDHGSPLFAQVKRLVPDLGNDLAIHPLLGQPESDGTLRLHKGSHLTLRLHNTSIPAALRLAGAEIRLDRHTLHLGTPNRRPLIPSPALSSSRVIINLSQIPQTPNGRLRKEALRHSFVHALKAELEHLHISKPFELTSLAFIKIQNQRLFGFSVRINNLNSHESLTLQSEGVGIKRHLGCGIFKPARW